MPVNHIQHRVSSQGVNVRYVVKDFKFRPVMNIHNIEYMNRYIEARSTYKFILLIIMQIMITAAYTNSQSQTYEYIQSLTKGNNQTYCNKTGINDSSVTSVVTNIRANMKTHKQNVHETKTEIYSNARMLCGDANNNDKIKNKYTV